MRFSRRGRRPNAGRIYAIGDVHGNLDQLEALLVEIRRDNARRRPRPTGIVMLGNLIDHGPDSEAVLDLCGRLRNENPLFEVLKGRHEVLMIGALKHGGDLMAEWIADGGRATLVSMGLKGEEVDALPPRDLLAAARRTVSPDIVHWLDGLRDRWSTGGYLFQPSETCSKSIFSRRKQELLLKRAAFTLRLTFSLGVRVRQTIMREGEQMDRASGNTIPVAAIGLERNRAWIIRPAVDAIASYRPDPL